ncbi:hypothetical protein DPMN_141133 [Dreissena polymorpha]|uniref:Uncharacterized protein n=1 Tax=Dreissena polymorpha TaxID=45954 RepID=A0A9D4G8W7_DREPO|nr:hypothetical protein DPMN_141133 [Dreissena polymorpha]
MHINLIVVGVAFGVTAFLPAVWSQLTCFVCVGTNDACNSWLTPTRTGCAVCTKVIDGEVVTKECGTSADADFCYGTADGKTRCVCHSSLCNSGGDMRVSLWTVGITTLLACLRMYL